MENNLSFKTLVYSKVAPDFSKKLAFLSELDKRYWKMRRNQKLLASNIKSQKLTVNTGAFLSLAVLTGLLIKSGRFLTSKGPSSAAFKILTLGISTMLARDFCYVHLVYKNHSQALQKLKQELSMSDFVGLD